VAVNDQDNAKALETIPGSLGLASLAQIMTEERRIKPLVFDGLEGTVEALSAGKYPYAKTHYIVCESKPAPEAQAFLDFIASPEGRDVLRASGHVVMCHNCPARRSASTGRPTLTVLLPRLLITWLVA
jgi:phosphate transport system substrate-binding protein